MQGSRVRRRTANSVIVSSYSEIAPEYYDGERHPTCANFRAASALYIGQALDRIKPTGKALEVGAGLSTVAEIFTRRGESISDLIMVDSSIEMLEHSSLYRGLGASCVIADARRLPINSTAANLLVASLGDPFNFDDFWQETARCLRQAGHCIFTTPSYEWASSFRGSSDRERDDLALFELRNGRSIYVPSIVHSIPRQVELIQRYGLSVVDVQTIKASSIPAPLSPKVSKQIGIVTGYRAIRR